MNNPSWLRRRDVERSLACTGFLLIAATSAHAGMLVTTFHKIADTNTAIPAGRGNFTSFDVPSIHRDNVAFAAHGREGQNGIYNASRQGLRRVADRRSRIPNGMATFSSLHSPSVHNNIIAFSGSGGTGADRREGIYANFGGERLFRRVDTDTRIPNKTGNFTGFSGHSISSGDGGSILAFNGRGEDGTGIYLHSEHVSLVADKTTPIPEGNGNFTLFGIPSLDGKNVAFGALGPDNQDGIYTNIGGLSRVVDTSVEIPGGEGKFTSVNAHWPSISGTHVGFFGSAFADGKSQQGIYTNIGGITRVADLQTQIPGGTGTFTNFLSAHGTPSLDATNVAFLGIGGSPSQGVYLSLGESLHRIVAVGDKLDGKTVQSLGFGSQGLSGRSLAFRATFADESQGLFRAEVAQVPEMSSIALWCLLTFVFVGPRLAAIGVQSRLARLCRKMKEGKRGRG